MNIVQLMETFDFKVTNGSEYLWNCYPNARIVDFESEFAYASGVYSIIDQTVYEVETDSKDGDHESPFRWINPKFKDAYVKEAESRNINPKIAWDNVEYVDVDDAAEFLSAGRQVFNGAKPETEIEFDLDHDVLLHHLLAAHEQNITFNTHISNVLRRYIETIKTDA